MSGYRSGLKDFLCVCLCGCLLVCSFSLGDYAVGMTETMVSRYRKLENSVNQTLNGSGSASQSKSVLIEGYGGGDYANSTVNADAPLSDIEALKKQAEALYKNYKKTGDIDEVQMGATSRTLAFGIIEVDNKTDETVSIKDLLSQKPSYKKITKAEPYILIYHTHSTEGYEMLDLGWYSNQYNSRTSDKGKNMVRVGDELTKALEDAGFKVIHDRNIYDTSYNGAYSRSRVSVEKYLKQYPSIQITLDVHRDAIHYESGTKCKPTAVINGKKAAQVMIISGCEGDGVEDFHLWKENLVFALGIQSSAEEKYSGLMRPVFFSNRKYNMDVTPCSLLLEFGTDANTLEEAVYSAQLIGEALGSMLNKEIKG